MQEIIGYLFFGLIFAGFPILFLVIAYRGIRTGVIYAKSHRYRRDERPIYFWATIVLYTGFAVFLGYCAIRFGIELWTHR